MNPTEQRERSTQIQRVDARIDSMKKDYEALTLAWDAEIKEQYDKLLSLIMDADRAANQRLTDSITAEGQQRLVEIQAIQKAQVDHQEQVKVALSNYHWDRQRLMNQNLWGRLRWLFTGSV